MTRVARNRVPRSATRRSPLAAARRARAGRIRAARPRRRPGADGHASSAMHACAATHLRHHPRALAVLPRCLRRRRPRSGRGAGAGLRRRSAAGHVRGRRGLRDAHRPPGVHGRGGLPRPPLHRCRGHPGPRRRRCAHRQPRALRGRAPGAGHERLRGRADGHRPRAACAGDAGGARGALQPDGRRHLPGHPRRRGVVVWRTPSRARRRPSTSTSTPSRVYNLTPPRSRILDDFWPDPRRRSRPSAALRPSPGRPSQTWPSCWFSRSCPSTWSASTPCSSLAGRRYCRHRLAPNALPG